MAAKPASTPRWADGGSAEVTEPASGKKDIGWLSAERPPAQYFNWLFNLIYQWMEYLDDGAFTGDHSIAGALTLTGGANGAKLEVNAADRLTVRNQADSANGDVEYADDHHGTKTLVIPAAAGQSRSDTTVGDYSDLEFDPGGGAPGATWRNLTTGASVDFPIVLPTGSRILTVTVHGHDGNGAGEYFQSKVWARALDGTTITQRGTTKQSAGTLNAFTTTVHNAADGGGSPLPITVTANIAYIVSVRLQSASGTPGPYVTGVQITYDRP